MRYIVVLLWVLFGSVGSAIAQVSVGIGFPGVSIGINLPVYPQLVQVPGYPVYYAPSLHSNFFFYDGMYWVYQGDNWYASSWYNGPWGLVGPQAVPLFVLRIPVRYYRVPPPYFHGWRADAPPRWGEHWGNDWEQQRRGWDQWDRHSVPARAPLPAYQRKYSGDRYPHQVEQQAVRNQNYRYQPRDPEVRQHYQAPAVQSAPPPSQRGREAAPQDRGSKSQDVQHSSPPPRAGKDADRPAQVAPQQRPPAAAQDQKQQPRQGSVQHEQPRPNQKDMQQGKGGPQESKRGQGQDKDADKGEGRNKQ